MTRRVQYLKLASGQVDAQSIHRLDDTCRIDWQHVAVQAPLLRQPVNRHGSRNQS